MMNPILPRHLNRLHRRPVFVLARHLDRRPDFLLIDRERVISFRVGLSLIRLLPYRHRDGRPFLGLATHFRRTDRNAIDRQRWQQVTG